MLFWKYNETRTDRINQNAHAIFGEVKLAIDKRIRGRARPSFLIPSKLENALKRNFFLIISFCKASEEKDVPVTNAMQMSYQLPWWPVKCQLSNCKWIMREIGNG